MNALSWLHSHSIFLIDYPFYKLPPKGVYFIIKGILDNNPALVLSAFNLNIVAPLLRLKLKIRTYDQDAGLGEQPRQLFPLTSKRKGVPIPASSDLL